jgi:hypothetical protein
MKFPPGVNPTAVDLAKKAKQSGTDEDIRTATNMAWERFDDAMEALGLLAEVTGYQRLKNSVDLIGSETEFLYRALADIDEFGPSGCEVG